LLTVKTRFTQTRHPLLIVYFVAALGPQHRPKAFPHQPRGKSDFIAAAMASQKGKTTLLASAAIPFAYRLILTTVEPLLAAGGALLVLRTPAEYLSTMTRGSGAFAAGSTFLYTELGGAWLYFAFVEAVVLRVFDDVRLWRLLCAGMLLSDAAYCHSAAQAVGGWAAWAHLAAWTSEDHLVFWTTAPMVLVRILVVLGVGVRTEAEQRKQA